MRFILSLVFIIFFSSANAISQENSIVVDIDYIIENSKKGKNLQKEISLKRDKNSKKFKEIEKNLKDKEKKLISKKNILSEKDFNKELKNFQDEVKQYNEKKQTEVSKLRKFRNESLAKLVSEINSIILDYSKKNNISMALDKKYVLLIKSENDITNVILEILNK